MDDIFGALLFKIFGPIIIVFAIIAMIVMGFQKGCSMIKGEKPKVEYVQPVEKKSLSHKAGHKTKEVAKDFVKGFFSK